MLFLEAGDVEIIKKSILLMLILSITIHLFGFVYATETLQNILLYHEMAEVLPEEGNTYYIEQKMFRKQMLYIKENCTILNISELIECYKNETQMPDNAVVVTFDDGYSSTYTYAFPVLKELDIPAIVFITTDTIGVDGHLTWQQIGEMIDSGLIAIGSHGTDHFDFTKLTESELYDSMYNSKLEIERQTGLPCKYVAYPYGLADNDTVRIAKDVGYEAGFVTYSTQITDELFGFKRSLINCNDNVDTLKNVILKNYIMGDVNDDRAFNLKDLTIIRRYISGTYDENINMYAADINGDRAVSFKDAVLIKRVLFDEYQKRV